MSKAIICVEDILLGSGTKQFRNCVRTYCVYCVYACIQDQPRASSSRIPQSTVRTEQSTVH